MLHANANIVNGNVSLISRLKGNLCKGIELATDYSGFGGPEESPRSIVQASTEHFSLGREAINVCILLCGDVDHACRQMLAETLRSSCSSGFVFGDILERCAEEDLSEMDRLLALHNNEVKGVLSRPARKRAIAKHSRDFFKQCSRVMFRKGRVCTQTSVAKCYHHDKLCSVLPPRSTSSRAKRIFVAGVIWHHGSFMGKRTGWLGESSRPYFHMLSELWQPTMISSSWSAPRHSTAAWV